MPYTKTELETVDFYQEFVSKLRTSYLEDLQEFAAEFTSLQGRVYNDKSLQQLVLEEIIFYIRLKILYHQTV